MRRVVNITGWGQKS